MMPLADLSGRRMAQRYRAPLGIFAGLLSALLWCNTQAHSETHSEPHSETHSAPTTLAPIARSSAWERIYRYEDDQGTLHLTNVPAEHVPMKRYSVLVSDPVIATMAQGQPPRGELPRSPELRRWVEEASRLTRLDSSLLYAIMCVESGYDPLAISTRGAQGVMQMMPDTARAYGVSNPFDARQSIFAGARHLRVLLDQFGDRLPLALAAYNAGAASVARYHDAVPPFEETRHYVPRVLGLYERFRSALAPLSATQ